MSKKFKGILISGTVAVSLAVTAVVGHVALTNFFDTNNIFAASSQNITLSDMPSEYKDSIEWVYNNRILVEDSISRRNLIFDQIFAGNGSLNYVIRWQSDEPLTLSVRQQIKEMLNRQINNWNNYLAGYDEWPYDSIDVNIPGWAVYDEAIIEDPQPDEIIYTDTITDVEYDIPYGYIGAYNSMIIVNDATAPLDYFYTVYSDNLPNFPKYENFYSMCNLESYAHVLGIDIQDAIAKVASLDDLWDIESKLSECEFYGIRGYESYYDTNGFGLVINNYTDLAYAIDNPEDSDLAEIYYLSGEYGSDPTADPESEFYEPPIEYTPSNNNQGSTNNKSSYPPKVNEYISYGYKVYRHNLCMAYYYKEDWNHYVLFCIDNRDGVKAAWAKSIAPMVENTAVWLTALN